MTIPSNDKRTGTREYIYIEKIERGRETGEGGRGGGREAECEKRAGTREILYVAWRILNHTRSSTMKASSSKASTNQHTQ